MRAALLTAAAIAVTAALLFARPHPTPGPPMRDFEAYYAAGAVYDRGGDPYSQQIWNAERALPGISGSAYQALPFVGPPAALPLFGLIARLPFSAANVLWRLLLIAACAVLAVRTLQLARIPIRLRTLAGIAVAALGFGPLTSALALGQIALPAFLFAALALSSPAAALLAWIQPNLALALFPQLLERRTWLWFVLTGAAFAGICLAVSGPGKLLHYAAVLNAHAAAERFSAIQITPAAIAYGLGARPALAAWIGVLVSIAAISAWIAIVRAESGLLERFCATCALLPLAVPFFHEHDLLIVFIPVIVYAAGAHQRIWPLAAAGGCLAATDWLGLAQRPDGTLQTILLVGGFAAALMTLRDRMNARMLVAPVLAAALIGAAALFAHAHAAPVWPDAMGPLPPGIQAAGIAAAWGAEQRATGLLAPDPVWAALRLLSLCGCALVASAIAISSRYPADSRISLPAPAAGRARRRYT